MKNFLYLILLGLVVLLFYSIRNSNISKQRDRPNKIQSVNPSINYKGQFKKGHARNPVSVDPKAFRNNARNRYYYKTHKEILKARRKQNKK
jgi:hypothetical protein